MLECLLRGRKLLSCEEDLLNSLHVDGSEVFVLGFELKVLIVLKVSLKMIVIVLLMEKRRRMSERGELLYRHVGLFLNMSYVTSIENSYLPLLLKLHVNRNNREGEEHSSHTWRGYMS